MLKAIALSLLLCVPNAFGAEPPYKTGEEITYSIQQLGMKAGKAVLSFKGPQTIDNQETLLIVFTSDGFNFYDEEKIYVDPKTYQPVRVDRDLNIFGKKEKITELYKDGKIEINKEDAKGNKTTEVLEKGDVDNIYGFIYRYRTEGIFKIGDAIDLRLPTRDIKITVKKNVSFNAAGKKFNSFFMESNPSKYKLWFDSGPHKLPLRIMGAFGAGHTVMIMTAYKE